MIKVLDREVTLREARLRLMDRIQSAADQRGPVTRGFDGGRLTEEVTWVENVGFWASLRDAAGRHWNGFGLGNPFEDATNVELVVEINLPKEGIVRTVGGLFAVDEEGGLHLLHRSLVGDGHTGIGKTGLIIVWIQTLGPLPAARPSTSVAPARGSCDATRWRM